MNKPEQYNSISKSVNNINLQYLRWEKEGNNRNYY